MGAVNVQGFFMLINEGQGFVVWEEGSLRPVLLIFYFSHQGLKQNNSRDLISGNGSDSVFEESLEKIKQGPKVSRRMIKMNGPRRHKTQSIQFQTINHDCQELLNLWRVREARSVRFFAAPWVITDWLA